MKLARPCPFTFVFSILLVFFAGTARAELRWNDIEVVFMNGASIPLNEEKTVSLDGYASLYWVPGARDTLYFLYLGPGFMAADWLWLSPKAGLIGNWVDGNKAAFMFSGQAALFFFDGQFDGLIEADMVLYPGKIGYYGYYSGNWNPKPWLNLGIQAEQVNLGIMAGPHVGIKKAPWSLEIQYYLYPTLDNHNLRVVNTLIF
jgi:hypothetical protein